MASYYAPYSQYRSLTGGMLTPGVRIIMIATVAAFILQLSLGDRFIALFALSPLGIHRSFLWQFATYMFLHSGLLHIVLNMLGLFFFGPETERSIGTGRFLVLYLVCGVLGGAGWFIWSWNTRAICLGASGAVFGVLAAFAALHPSRPVTLLVFFFLPVTMRARTMAIGLGIFNLLAMVSQPGQIAYAAHLAGGLAGYAYIRLLFNRPAAGLGWNPRRWLNNLRWRWHRRKFSVIAGGQDWQDEPEDISPADVDAVLDKISRWGLGSLNARERAILDRAGRRGR